MLLDTRRFMATILNRRKYLKLIKDGDKNCEIKPKKLKIPPHVTHLLMCGNSFVRKVYGKYLVARLRDRRALGPFYTGKDLLKKSNKFKTGMSEAELDQFIQSKSSKKVYVYRFCDVRETQDVDWHHCQQNNNAGFLLPTRTDGTVRYSVRISQPRPAVTVAAAAPKPVPESERRIMQGPKIPRRAGVVRRAVVRTADLPSHIDLTLDD
jgi:hypothetical protein